MEASTNLPLNEGLKKQWASGKMSAVQVQDLADRAQRQGAHGIGKLSGGSYHRNAHRALVNFFGYPDGAPDFTWIQLPVVNGKAFHPVLLPHDFFGSLFHGRRNMWDKRIKGHDGLAKEFWENLHLLLFIANLSDI